MNREASGKGRIVSYSLVYRPNDPAFNDEVPIILAGGSRPALRTKVLNDPRLMTELKAHKVFAKALLEAEPWQMPANFRWPEFNSTVAQVFGGVWAGTETLQQALPQAKKKLQDVIDKPAID